MWLQQSRAGAKRRRGARCKAGTRRPAPGASATAQVGIRKARWVQCAGRADAADRGEDTGQTSRAQTWPRPRRWSREAALGVPPGEGAVRGGRGGELLGGPHCLWAPSAPRHCVRHHHAPRAKATVLCEPHGETPRQNCATDCRALRLLFGIQHQSL